MFPTFFIPAQLFFYLTSNNYPIVVVESVGSNSNFNSGFAFNGLRNDYFSSNTSFSSATLTVLLRSYNNYPYEEFTSNTSFGSGSLTSILISYNNFQVESISSNTSFVSGTLT